MENQHTPAILARSALAHLPRGADAGAPLRLRDVRRSALVQVAAWPDTLPNVRWALGEALGFEPPRTGHAAAGAAGSILALGAGRYLVASSSAKIRDRLQGAIGVTDGTVTDLSHGRTTLVLEGEPAAAVLAKGLAIDLHMSVFPPGRVAQSVIHHIDVTVHRVEVNLFELTVLRGFAEDFVHWLMDAGLEFGIVFAGPTA